MDWAAWGPTIVSIITCFFFAGVLYSNQNNHDKHLTEHDFQLDEHTRDLTDHAVKLGKLEAWKEGYAAARSTYDHSKIRTQVGA
jgi:hypothetical protein